MRQCSREPWASSGSHAQLPSVGGLVVTVTAFSTAGLYLSSMAASNCKMIGAATPTFWPSESWNCPLTCLVGAMVVKPPVTAEALPSRPTTDPVQV